METIEQEDVMEPSAPLAKLREITARNVAAGGAIYARTAPWDASSDEAAASTSAWEKLAEGTILDDLTPEELYVVYCEVTDAAKKMGVAV